MSSMIDKATEALDRAARYWDPEDGLFGEGLAVVRTKSGDIGIVRQLGENVPLFEGSNRGIPVLWLCGEDDADEDPGTVWLHRIEMTSEFVEFEEA